MQFLILIVSIDYTLDTIDLVFITKISELNQVRLKLLTIHVILSIYSIYSPRVYIRNYIVAKKEFVCIFKKFVNLSLNSIIS